MFQILKGGMTAFSSHHSQFRMVGRCTLQCRRYRQEENDEGATFDTGIARFTNRFEEPIHRIYLKRPAWILLRSLSE